MFEELCQLVKSREQMFELGNTDLTALAEASYHLFWLRLGMFWKYYESSAMSRESHWL